MLLDTRVEFLLQMELIDQFNTTQVNSSKEKEEFDICKYWA